MRNNKGRFSGREGAMSSTLLTEILSLIFRTPQAHDDNFLSLSTGLTEDSTGTVFLSVTANDAGKVKSLYSIDDGGSWFDVLQLLWRDTGHTEAASSDKSDDGAKMWITTDGRVAYDASTWSAAFRTEVQHLAAGEYTQDDFIYAIQLNGGALSWAHVTLQIAGVNDAPVATAFVNSAIEGGALVTGQVHATDVDHGAILTYGLVEPAPAGLQLTAGGAYTFDPTVPAYDHLAAGATETVVTQYRATDEHGASGTSTLTITITGTNDKPVAIADTIVTDENQKLSIDVLANDTDVDDGHVLTLENATAPDGKGTVSIDANMVVFDPGTAFEHLGQGERETVRVAYTMHDEHGAASSSFVDVTVTGRSAGGPVAVADSAAGGENELLTIDALANDTDAGEGHVLTLVSATGPEGKGTASLDGNKVVFDPGTVFDHLAQGETETVRVAYTMQDERGASSSSFVDVTLTGENDAPVAAPDSIATGENQSLGIDVLANDSDVDDRHALTVVSAVAPGAKGTATSDGNMVDFDPGAAFDHLSQGATETVRVEYTMQDEYGAPSSSFVDVTLIGENDSPVAVADAALTGENQPLGIDVLANDTDLDDGHVLTLVSAAASEGKGTGAIDGNTIMFDPGTAFDHLAQGATETVRVAYTMQDEFGAPSTSFVDVTVTGDNDTPIAAADVGATGENAPIGIEVLANDTDVDDGHVLKLVSATAHEGKGTASIDSNMVVFDPGTAFDHLAQDATETVRVGYTMQDEHGASSTAYVDVTLTGENDAPVAFADAAVTGENDPVGIDVLANDTDVDDGHVLTLVSAVALEGKGSASIDGNSVLFDPGTAFDHLEEGQSETVRVGYTTQDEHGSSSSSFADVTVTGANDAPVAVADVAATGENQGLIIDVLANDTDVDDGHVLTLVSAAAPEAKGTVSLDGNNVVFDPGTAFEHLAEGASETVTLSYSVTDEHGAASSSTVQVTITGENDAPLAMADTATGGENQRLSMDVLANDKDVDDAHVLTLVSATAPDGKGTATLDGNRVVFDPGTTFDHLAQGEKETVRVAYTVQDEHGAPSSSFVDVTVMGENDAPVAKADNAAGSENDVLTVDVLANDADIDDGHVLTVVAASAATGFGSASIVGNQVVFDTGSDFDRLAAGAKETVQVSYTMQDQHGAQSISSIAITLNGVNDAPAAHDDTALTDEDTAVSGNVLSGANGGADRDVDGDALSVASVGTFATALGGTITLSANGVFTYDPTGSAPLQGLEAGQSAIDTFKYSVSDGNGGTESATLSVTVAGVNEPAKGSAVLSSIEPGTNLDYYIRFDGTGVANSWLKLGGFSQSFTAESGVAGKVTATDVETLLGSSSAMPDLVGTLGDGTHLKGVEIEAYTQGTTQLVDQYSFSDAVLTRLQASDFGFGTGDSVDFNFAGFAHSHQELDAKGAPGPVTSVGWDLANGTPVSAPAHTADALGGTLADTVPSDAQLAYFMTFDGAPGWLKVSSFSTGMSGATGPATAEDVVLTLGSSKELVQLSEMLLSGKELKGVEVEAYRMGGAQPQLVDEYKFQDVTVSGLTTSNATDNTLSFKYAQYADGHIAYDAKGAPSTITTGGWDFSNNTAVSGGTPVGDAIGNQVAGGVAPGTSLDYYIRFDGTGVANSWLKLGSFSDRFDADTSGAGKVSASDVAGMLGSNSAMPDLFEMLANGTHLNGVEIEAYSQGTAQLVDQYFFSNAVLTDLHVGGSGGGTTDSLSFDFAGFAHSHQELDAKGAPGSVSSVGWDFINAEPASVPGHAADAVAAKLADSLAIDAPLSYFMTYDGAPGWLQVSSFDTGLSGGTGQATPEDVVLTLGSSNQLVQLTDMLLSGKQLKGVEVEAYRMDGAQPRLVDEYKFQNVTLSGLDTANASANALSFDYTKYAEGHIAYDAKGAPSTITTGGWDFSNNAAFSGGTPVGDAISKQLAGGVAPGTDLDYYIRFDTAGVLNTWLKLGAFSESFAAAGAGGAGKVMAFDVMGLLGSNSAMPNLVEALGNGTHLNGVEIEAYSQGTAQLVDQYFFADAALTGLQVNGSVGFTADSVSFDFGAFAHSHQELDAKGAPGPVSSVGWDFVNARPQSAPAHTADAVGGTLADALPMDAPLSYFVTYDGAPGWLPVSGFSTGMSGGTGQAMADDVMLALGSSKQLVELTQALLSGKHLNSVEVEAYRMDGAQPQLVDEYHFEDVTLNGLATSSPTDNTLSFSYGKYAEGHIAYDPNGAQSLITTGGWDFTHNTPFSSGTPHGDIDFTA
jgi:VCBS repeat-containing protein